MQLNLNTNLEAYLVDLGRKVYDATVANKSQSVSIFLISKNNSFARQEQFAFLYISLPFSANLQGWNDRIGSFSENFTEPTAAL